jgi:prepilin-type N-terminal cleavage/methylation domain-containing protein
MRNDKGFTMVEILVVLVVGVIIAGGVMLVLSGGRRSSRIADLDSQAQQNARVAVDNLVKDLRSNGYGIDIGNGQTSLAHAGPYDVVFNANIDPVPDQGSTPGYPAAINTSSSPLTVPPSGTVLYSPSGSFETGAETIRFTLDSNNDGVVDANDKGDDTIEDTQNPNDYVVLRQVYGFDGSSNGGANEPLALLRGPDLYPDGTNPHPLFTYWYDHDDSTSTPDRLWGDNSGNGVLEDAEITSLTAVSSSNLGRVNRIGITATGAARSPDSRHSGNDGFRETVMTSEVNVRRSKSGTTTYIKGAVFDDLNGDGTWQAGEPGLSGVAVRLNNGARKSTGANGGFVFRVEPGVYTVTETDPVGYTSTTPNAVAVTASKGTVVAANFGDRAIGGYGGILGRVWEYEDLGAGPELTGFGLPDVEIYLDTGERDTTDNRGAYLFLVPVSSYSITMEVPAGYQAIGPVSVTRSLTAEGDTAMVDFGLIAVAETGTIAGKVFNDSNSDGVIDAGEPGISSVSIMLSSGDSTVTDANGDYSFTVVPGTYDVTEEDLGGYMSTTINNITGIVIVPDTTVTVNFGDMFAGDLNFTVITLGQTQRALCIDSEDLGETGDNNNDKEILLGTKYVSGISNLNIWKNEWKNQSTPNSAVFDQNPWYNRTPTEDILSIAMGDLGGDSRNDVITGLTSASGKVLVWITQGSGNDKGVLPTTPNSFFISNGIADVLSAVLYPIDADADMDAIIGTEYLTNQGRFEVWFNDGSGTFSNTASDVYQMAGAHLLGSVMSIGIGQVVGSHSHDVVLGTATGVNTGKIEIFRDNGAPNGRFTYFGTIDATGEVNSIALYDMLEDSYGDLDIIAGTTTGLGTGIVELWLNNGDGTFGVDTGMGAYAPSDTARFNGEILTLGVNRMDRDIYPDIAVGLKRANVYSGALAVMQCYGYMPSGGSAWMSADIGEAITLTVSDFNKDYAYDMAVGTRTSFSQGHVVVFFNDNN